MLTIRTITKEGKPFIFRTALNIDIICMRFCDLMETGKYKSIVVEDENSNAVLIYEKNCS